MRLPIPKGIERRLQPHKERADRFLRNWEWTWASTFVVGVIISFIAMTTLVVIPSWMLFFADDTLQWRTRLQITMRDLIVTGWTGTWAAIFVITAYFVQTYRRKLRGERQADRYSGGYR